MCLLSRCQSMSAVKAGGSGTSRLSHMHSGLWLSKVLSTRRNTILSLTGSTLLRGNPFQEGRVTQDTGAASQAASLRGAPTLGSAAGSSGGAGVAHPAAPAHRGLGSRGEYEAPSSGQRRSRWRHPPPHLAKLAILSKVSQRETFRSQPASPSHSRPHPQLSDLRRRLGHQLARSGTHPEKSPIVTPERPQGLSQWSSAISLSPARMVGSARRACRGGRQQRRRAGGSRCPHGEHDRLLSQHFLRESLESWGSYSGCDVTARSHPLRGHRTAQASKRRVTPGPALKGDDAQYCWRTPGACLRAGHSFGGSRVG